MVKAIWQKAAESPSLLLLAVGCWLAGRFLSISRHTSHFKSMKIRLAWAYSYNGYLPAGEEAHARDQHIQHQEQSSTSHHTQLTQGNDFGFNLELNQ